jgi:predicted NACHT family NTPase
VAERFGSIELRGIQLNHRVILDLDQVFVPLHFDELTTGKHGPGRHVVSSAPGRRPIEAVVKEDTRILLIGSPGSGKSTLLSFLASRCARGAHGLSWPDRALPFVIAVRELKDAKFSPKWIGTQLEIAPEVVMGGLSEERAVLLVDGLDEALQKELRSQLLAALARVSKLYPRLPMRGT